MTDRQILDYRDLSYQERMSDPSLGCKNQNTYVDFFAGNNAICALNHFFTKNSKSTKALMIRLTSRGGQCSVMTIFVKWFL